MATIAGNNNKVRSGLKRGLDSGLLAHAAGHILGTAPQDPVLCLYRAGAAMLSVALLMP